MRIEDMIAAIQAELGVGVDGKAGPETWGAIYKAIIPGSKRKLALATEIPPADSRSEKIITTLLPEVQPYARALVHKAKDNGITIRIISGLRSYEQQDVLYAQGRTAPGKIVTKARAGYSNHNFGIAFDVGVFKAGKYLGDSPWYKVVGALGMELGLEWGGSWKSLVDQPHFQLRPDWARDLNERDMLAQLRQRRQQAEAVYA